ncbi:MAG: regulatory iron-sulfur-containing complex subunit RicT [candidate division WOR-3 bacterium]
MTQRRQIHPDSCQTKAAKAALYEVKINPFRREYFVMSSAKTFEWSLNTQLVILCGKELLLGTLTKQKFFYDENYTETITQHYTRYLPHLHYEPGFNRTDHAPDFCQIIRIATEEDLALRANLEKEMPRLKTFFEDLLREFKLPAKIVCLDISLNRYKIYVYFTSPQKINYQLLHEQASETLKTRVEIKQVGTRDHARAVGGIGICGRLLCCESFLKNIPPVTLAKIREANIVFEPEKLSGVCSKLRCCLLYEIPKTEENKQ